MSVEHKGKQTRYLGGCVEHVDECGVIAGLHDDTQLGDATWRLHVSFDMHWLVVEPDEEGIQGGLLPVARREKPEVELHARVLLELRARALGRLGDVAPETCIQGR